MKSDEIRRRFLDFRMRLYEQHDLSAIETHLHPDFISHNPLISGSGPAAYKTFVQSVLFRGVPNLRAVRQQVLVEGERLMAMTGWEATHTGLFLGVPPTGRAIRFQTADLYEVRDGLLLEHWDVVDRLDASFALGLIDPKGPLIPVPKEKDEGY